jgi:hypothetical protein
MVQMQRRVFLAAIPAILAAPLAKALAPPAPTLTIRETLSAPREVFAVSLELHSTAPATVTVMAEDGRVLAVDYTRPWQKYYFLPVHTSPAAVKITVTIDCDSKPFKLYACDVWHHVDRKAIDVERA